MGDSKGKKQPTKKDLEEVRPPIDTGGLTFDQMLEKVANVDPKGIKDPINDHEQSRK